MTEPLTPARFAALADAYGGAVARWPEEVRAEAMAMARFPAMQAVLAEAGQLDARLDLWRVAAPPAGLRDAILVTRPVPLSRRVRWWWSGLAIATAVAGASIGSVAIAAVLPADRAIADEATAFGDFAQAEN